MYFVFFASCVIILPCARVRRTSGYNSTYHTYTHLHGATPKELVRSLIVLVQMCFAGVQSISLFYSCNRARISHERTHRYSHAFAFCSLPVVSIYYHALVSEGPRAIVSCIILVRMCRHGLRRSSILYVRVLRVSFKVVSEGPRRYMLSNMWVWSSLNKARQCHDH